MIYLDCRTQRHRDRDRYINIESNGNLHWSLSLCRMNTSTQLYAGYFYCLQTKFAKVMFLRLSVSHSVLGGGGVSASVHDGIHTPWEADTLLAQCMLGDTSNKGAVRILLECILVFYLCIGLDVGKCERTMRPVGCRLDNYYTSTCENTEFFFWLDVVIIIIIITNIVIIICTRNRLTFDRWFLLLTNKIMLIKTDQKSFHLFSRDNLN